MLFGLFSLLLNQIFGNSVVPIGTKIASPIIGPLPFVFFRFLVSTMFLLIIYLLSKKKRLTIHEYKSFVTLGFLLMTNVTLFTLAIAHTTVIMSTLIFSLTPLLVGIGGHFFLQESFDKQKIIGLFVSFVGLLFLISQSFTVLQKNAFGEPLGNILICFATIGYSLYLLYSRRVLYKNDNFPIQTTFLTFVFTTILLLPLIFFGVLFGSIGIKPLSVPGLAGVTIVGIGSVVQYLFLQIGIKKINAFTASLFQYMGPFIAASITIPLLHERVTLQLFVGGLLILIGVFIATSYEQLKGKFFTK